MSERDDIDTDELAAKREAARRRSALDWLRQVRQQLAAKDDK